MEEKRKSLFDPTVKEGDVIDLHGVPVHVVNQEAIDVAVENDDMVVVCCLVEEGHEDCVIPGSKKAICGKCRRDVWLSPATSSFVGLARLRCVECLLEELQKT
jgi:hypothetical protein